MKCLEFLQTFPDYVEKYSTTVSDTTTMGLGYFWSASPPS